MALRATTQQPAPSDRFAALRGTASQTAASQNTGQSKFIKLANRGQHSGRPVNVQDKSGHFYTHGDLKAGFTLDVPNINPPDLDAETHPHNDMVLTKPSHGRYYKHALEIEPNNYEYLLQLLALHLNPEEIPDLNLKLQEIEQQQAGFTPHLNNHDGKLDDEKDANSLQKKIDALSPWAKIIYDMRKEKHMTPEQAEDVAQMVWKHRKNLFAGAGTNPSPDDVANAGNAVQAEHGMGKQQRHTRTHAPSFGG